jgi:Transmembrane secretion effector
VEYEVEPRKSDEFLEALHKFARVRRWDRASRWGVYRDTEHPAHYIETLIVESWAEHLRQHERLTSADRELEDPVPVLRNEFFGLCFHSDKTPLQEVESSGRETLPTCSATPVWSATLT